MSDGFLFSEDCSSIDFSEATLLKAAFGPKGAMLATLPRAWTLPFALFSADQIATNCASGSDALRELKTLERVVKLGHASGKLIVRSSILGESIWDRGSYKSVIVKADLKTLAADLTSAISEIRESAEEKPFGIVVQGYLSPKARGEFGNLHRISKTRDHWELSLVGRDGEISKNRFNTQRDESANTETTLYVRAGISRERLFSSIGAWINNYLLRSRPQRVNCEWITDNQAIYIVQIDEEDEDVIGLNPYQLRTLPTHQPTAATGAYLKSPDSAAINKWDKLKVLEELWEPNTKHKPMLFYVPLSQLPQSNTEKKRKELTNDFRALIGHDNIVVRTSVRCGAEKKANLPRTECLKPEEAADWCLRERDKLAREKNKLTEIAFVAHRFISARASAWVRADPQDPIVEINSLWGLPDALQYCPYDIWEVHVPTKTTTDYPEYKSDILIPDASGAWEYVRVKNELARGLSIGRPQAIDVAQRTWEIAKRLGRACHVMWFVECVDTLGERFNTPWYWTEAHDFERNPDRSHYKVVTISSPATLETFLKTMRGNGKYALELKPDITLLRDEKFITAVGKTAHDLDIPVILNGSTLAHAYYQLRREKSTVVTRGEKEHSRLRRNMNFGKLVRDKIPERIAQRQEAEITRKLPTEVVKGFLTSKLLEEALEVRKAIGETEKITELADVYEVFQALVRAEGASLKDVLAKSKEKRMKAGGFDEGLVLIQTGILGRDRTAMKRRNQPLTQVLARKVSSEAYDIPFSFFGFMELDQPRYLHFENLDVKLEVTLRSDRLELKILKDAEQFELPLDLSVASAPTAKKTKSSLKKVSSKIHKRAKKRTRIR